MSKELSTTASALTRLPERKAKEGMFRVFWLDAEFEGRIMPLASVPRGKKGLILKDFGHEDYAEERVASEVAMARQGIVYDDQGRVIYRAKAFPAPDLEEPLSAKTILGEAPPWGHY